MPNLIFEYIVKNKNSFINRVTIKNNIITFFENQNIVSKKLSELIILRLFKQCNKVCKGEIFEFLKNYSPEHKIFFPHVNTSEQKLEHSHLRQCQLVIPEDLYCFLDQLKEIQKNPDLREKIFQHPDIKYSQSVLSFFEKNPITFDLKSDYLSDIDIEDLKKTFTDYYAKNKEALILQYEQAKKDLTWADELTEIGECIVNSAYESAKYSALFNIFHESLLANNVEQNQAEWITYSVILATMTVTQATWTPLIFAIATIALLKAFQFRDDKARFCSSVTATLAAITPYLPTTAFDCVKFSAALLTAITSSTLTASISTRMTRWFWQKIYRTTDAVENTKQITEAETSTKLHAS